MEESFQFRFFFSKRLYTFGGRCISLQMPPQGAEAVGAPPVFHLQVTKEVLACTQTKPTATAK